MIKRAAWLYWFSAFLLFPSLLLASTPTPPLSSAPKIIHDLDELQNNPSEDKHLELVKSIHDEIVHSNLTDPQIVKELNPAIEQVLRAMDSGLDRPYLSGKSLYLASAVNYFDREKGDTLIEIPEDQMPLQACSSEGTCLSTFPDKILITKNKITLPLYQVSGIHEAVISLDGKKVAFFRTEESSASKFEIWIVDVKSKKAKKVCSIPSCYTLLFSPDRGIIYFQEKPAETGQEASIFRVSTWGGKSVKIGKGTLLQSVVLAKQFKGSLIIYRSIPTDLETTQQECPYVMSKKGMILGRVKNLSCR